MEQLRYKALLCRVFIEANNKLVHCPPILHCPLLLLTALYPPVHSLVQVLPGYTRFAPEYHYFLTALSCHFQQSRNVTGQLIYTLGLPAVRKPLVHILIAPIHVIYYIRDFDKFFAPYVMLQVITMIVPRSQFHADEDCIILT